MKITICGSNSFQEQMREQKGFLEQMGHEVLLPSSAEEHLDKTYWDSLEKKEPEGFPRLKAERIEAHFQKIAVSDAILVLNYDKNGIKNYIGGNTLMEMATAFYLKKKIFLLHEIPEMQYTQEIIGMLPTLLYGNIKNLH